MRVFVVPVITLGADKARYDSGYLLASKLGQLAERTQAMHVYLLAPHQIRDWMPENNYFTVLELPPHMPFKDYPNPGCMVDPRALVAAAQDYGPDVFIVTQSSALALYSFYVCSTQFINLAPVRFVLWDFSPESADTVERNVGSAHPAFTQMCALGYTMADAAWLFGPAAARAAILEVSRRFGWAAAEALEHKAHVLTPSIDRAYMQAAVPEPQEKRERFTVHIGGRWSATKRYGMALKAIFKAKAAGLDIDVLYTGSKPSGNDKLARAEEVGMQWVTGLDQVAMWEVATSCHVGILTQDSQAMPSLPVEQLALGLPVLIRGTEHLVDTFPQYPLVFTTDEELLQLLTYAYHNYEAVWAEARAWFAEHWQAYDITSLVPHLQALTGVTREATSLPVLFDETGEVQLNVKRGGQPGRKVYHSVLRRVSARREALRLGYRERLADARPRFDEPEDENHDSSE